MSVQSKLSIVLALIAAGVGSSAYAQGYTAGWGTGNVVPSYFDGQGRLHEGAPVAERERHLARAGATAAFASEQSFATGSNTTASDSPNATGGGSTGYNDRLRNDY